MRHASTTRGTSACASTSTSPRRWACSRAARRGSRILSVAVNGAPARLGRRLKIGDLISLTCAEPPASDCAPEDIPLQIIFENDDVIVIDKPQGMVVHPGSGNHSGTLLNALLFHCAGLAAVFPAEDPRPGIVHRLDKETSGVIIAAKNVRAHELLSAQFKSRAVQKRYIAVVAGRLRPGSGKDRNQTRAGPAQQEAFHLRGLRGKELAHPLSRAAALRGGKG